MYPNLYYVFKDWFGVEINFLKILNSFGLMVALAFIAAAWVLSSELKRKEKQGLLHPREEIVVVGKPAGFVELLINGLVGFIFGFKLFGFFGLPEGVSPQDFIFSGQGNFLGGLVVGAAMAGLKWYEKNKQALKTPEHRPVRIWPHDRVQDFAVLALIFGVLGAKLFDSFENWDEFIANPIKHLFSNSGLTFYGGLILAAIVICWYAYKKRIKLRHLVDAAAPGLMLAYAIGRIGCQVAGDGDWGVFNSAYVSNEYGKVSLAKPGEYESQLKKYSTYFLEGRVMDSTRKIYVTDRIYPSLEAVPHRHVVAPSFLPTWMVAYTYPKNVNADGIPIPGDADEHNKVLPQPVFPTPFYETILGTCIFLFLWAIRKRIKTPLVMFGLYLVLNGIERFVIETIRVNKLYEHFWSFSQAEIIAICLVIAGIGFIVFGQLKYKNQGA